MVKKLWQWMLFCLGFFPALAQAQAEILTTDTTSTWQARPINNFFRNEIAGFTENDNFALQIRDGYYTNGLIFKFSRAKSLKNGLISKLKGVTKMVQGYELGQQIFNPVRFDSIRIATQDRPFSAYLYAKFDQRIFLGTNRLLQWSVSLGNIGSASMGKQVQRWYHRAIGIYDVKGWSTQLNNEPNLTISGQYAGSLLKGPVEQRRFDVAAVGQAQLGNAFTDVSGGVLLRGGIMENFCNSAHFNSRVTADSSQAPVHRKEFYFFIHPSLTWQAYNATLQGGMFIADKGPKTVAIEPFYFTTRFGVRFAQHRFTWGIEYINRQKQAKGQLRIENYVSIQIAYRMGKILTQ